MRRYCETLMRIEEMREVMLKTITDAFADRINQFIESDFKDLKVRAWVVGMLLRVH